MEPYSYQNGGDWTWFGARMVTQLIRYDLLDEAREALDPMLMRVIKNKVFTNGTHQPMSPKAPPALKEKPAYCGLLLWNLKRNTR